MVNTPLAFLALAAAAAPHVQAALAPTPVFDALLPRQTQGADTPLYLHFPACDFYQCAYTVNVGDVLAANWLNPPPGNVNIDMLAEAGSVVAHHVATVPALSQAGYCDAGQGVGVVVDGVNCGRFEWIVPSDWATSYNGNYTVRASSVENPSIESYTDVVLVRTNASTPANVAFAPHPIQGAPTRTVFGQGRGQVTTAVPTAGVSSGSAPVAAPTSTGAVTAASSSTTSGSTRPTSSVVTSVPARPNGASGLTPARGAAVLAALVFGALALC